jgi:hypothetical protein
MVVMAMVIAPPTAMEGEIVPIPVAAPPVIPYSIRNNEAITIAPLARPVAMIAIAAPTDFIPPASY